MSIDKDQIIKLYTTPHPDGTQRTQEEVSQELGYCTNTVHKYLKSAGISPASNRGIRNRVLTPEQISLAIERYTTPNPDGTWAGTNSIVRELGLGVSTVTLIRQFKNHGIQIRPPKERLANGKACKPITNKPPEKERPPICACGCGESVIWSGHKSRWTKFHPGHYNAHRPYKDKEWLEQEYIHKSRTVSDIALSLGVNNSTITAWLGRLGVEKRTQGESLSLSGSVRGPNNPSWKGGVAKWNYSYNWKQIARIVRNRDEWTCQGCGEKRARWGIHLHVHHIDENKFNNHPHNLISLCPACHHPSHGNPIIRSRLEKIARSRPWIDID